MRLAAQAVMRNGFLVAVFLSLVNPHYPRQLKCGRVGLLSSEEDQVSIRAAEDLASIPENRRPGIQAPSPLLISPLMSINKPTSAPKAKN